MHVLQEVLELFHPTDSDEDDTPAEVHLMAAETQLCNPSKLTFQLTACVQGQQVQFLIDSGSTHPFLNSKFLPLLGSI